MSRPDFDPEGMASRDIQRLKQMQSTGDVGPGARLELVFGGLTMMTGMVWMLSIIWVPDPIDGGVWMGLGLLFLGMFGAPTGAVYWLRRGGADIVRQMVRQVVRE